MRCIDADAMLVRLEEWNTSDPTDKTLYNFALHRILEQPTIEGDLISRQAAIAELEERKYANRTSVPVVSELNKSIGYIMRLPSIQPEIIRCQDCAWWRKSEDSLQGCCIVHNLYPTGDYYCATARRREDE